MWQTDYSSRKFFSPSPAKTRFPVDHIRYVFYALASEAWRVDALERVKNEFFDYIKANPYTKKIADFEPMDIAIGQLLGYTEEQINAFLAHQRRLSDKTPNKNTT